MEECFEQNKWTWNMCVSVFLKENPLTEFKAQLKENPNRAKISQQKFRDHLRKWKYTEEVMGRTTDGRPIVLADFVKDDAYNSLDLPDWWSFKHNRIPRGAIYDFVSNLNSNITNYKKHDRDFSINFRKKKSTSSCFFEDAGYPAFINNIRSYYGYTRCEAGKRRRVNLSLKDVGSHVDLKSIRILKDHNTGCFYLHLSVPVQFHLPHDKRSESQATPVPKEDIIALDPGVRTFLSGYSLNDAVEIGDQAALEIFSLLEASDQISIAKTLPMKSREKNLQRRRRLHQKIRHMVEDLHWKAIKYLTGKYRCIIYPDFRTSGMMRRLRHAPTKRKLQAFAFHKFKERLIYKCKATNTTLILMNESYTSRTCSCCGHVNLSSTSKTFQCQKCQRKMDRDFNGARNIMIKSLGFFQE